MTERVVIPPAEQIEITPAALHRSCRPASTCPSSPAADLVPEMVKAGDGYRLHVTGLTHDERGYPVDDPRGPGTSSSTGSSTRSASTPKPSGDYEEDRRRGRRRRRRLLRHHLPRRHRGHRAGPGRGDQGRPCCGSSSCLAVPGKSGSASSPARAKPSSYPRSTTARWSWRSSARPGARPPVVLAAHGGGTVHDPEDIVDKIDGGLQG